MAGEKEPRKSRAIDRALVGPDASKDEELIARSRQRAKAMLNDLVPAQRDLVLDDGPYIAARCPRRWGKTYAVTLAALITGEAKPGSITLIISLTLKAIKRNYWVNPKSSIKALSRKFGLKLETNDSELRWEHENGSIGYLLGAESLEQIEYLRGIEADLYVIDECKSFAASVLDYLMDDIIDPQRISRLGRVMMIGTPGSVLDGPFFRATNPLWKYPDLDPETGTPHRFAGMPACVIHGKPDPAKNRTKGTAWSLHVGSLRDNTKMPHQWEQALLIKDKRGYADNHPTWRREFLAEWVASAEGLVYRYVQARVGGVKVNWFPNRTVENPTGLPAEYGPWRLLFGLDLGYHDATALVVAAYSTTHKLLVHVWDKKQSGMDVDDAQALVKHAVARFGHPDCMWVDTSGGGSRMLAENLRKRWAFPIERAVAKAEKNEHIEFINADFDKGRIWIIAGTDLEAQLSSSEWDQSKAKGSKAIEELAREGKLQVNRLIPDDVADAFRYLYVGAMHHFARPEKAKEPDPGTPEAIALWERAAFLRACRQERLRFIKEDSKFGGKGKDPGIRHLSSKAMAGLHDPDKWRTRAA